MSDKPVNDIRDMVKSMSSLPEGSGESEYNFRIYVNPVVQIRDMLDGMIGEGGSGLIADGSVTTDKLADGAVTQDKLSDDISLGGAGTYFGNCVSTADAAVKVVTVEDQDFSLTTGTRVRVWFVNGNTNDGVQNFISLNVNNTGNHEIIYRGNTPGSSSGTPFYMTPFTGVMFVYNMYGYWEAEEVSNNYFANCLTEENEGVKRLNTNGMVIVDGTSITVEFEYGNTANVVSLLVNSNLSFPVFYDDDYTSSINKFTWVDGSIITFVFKQGVFHTTSIGPVRGQSGGGGGDDGGSWYGTTSAMSSDRTKNVVCANFSLKGGAIITVRFQNGNSHYGPRLNVNGTGTHDIRVGNSAASTNNPLIMPNDTKATFVFDSTNSVWHLMNGAAIYSGELSGDASSATKSISPTIVPIIVDGTVIVAFSNTGNTYDQGALKLNVTFTGGADIFMNNIITSATNKLLWDAGATLVFVRRGAAWHLLSKLDPVA